jgi:hypothetical protein
VDGFTVGVVEFSPGQSPRNGEMHPDGDELSRRQLDRILDPNNDKIQLDTVFKAARAWPRSEAGGCVGACCPWRSFYWPPA